MTSFSEHPFLKGVRNPFNDDLIEIRKKTIEEMGGQQEFFESYRNKKPVVLLGIANKWKAIELWKDLELLKTRLLSFEEFEKKKEQ